MSVEAVERFMGLPREQQLKNPLMVSLVAGTVEQSLKRELFPHEVRMIQTHIVTLRDDKEIQDIKIQKLVSNLASIFIDNFRSLDNEIAGDIEYDTKTLASREIGINSENNQIVSQFETEVLSTQQATYQNLLEFFQKGVNITGIAGQTDPYDLLKLVNPRQLWTRTDYWLDSRNRSNPNTTVFTNLTWGIAFSANVSEGTANNINIVRDIVRMRVPKIRLPQPQNALGASPTNNFNVITMQISELANVGMIALQQKIFQFTFDPISNNRYIDITPQMDGIVEFQRPSNIQGFNISFGSPLNSIIFDPDRKRVTFTYGAVTTVIVDNQESHYLANNDLVTFNQFTTNTVPQSADASVIATMNGTFGLQVTVINAYTFTIPVNTASIATPTPGLNIFCYFESKRIQFRMNVEFVEPKSF